MIESSAVWHYVVFHFALHCFLHNRFCVSVVLPLCFNKKEATWKVVLNQSGETCKATPHSAPEGCKIKNKFTGAGIGAKFSTIMYRITKKNLKIGQRGLFEKKRFLYFHLMARMQIFGSKMQFFGSKSIFFRNHPFFLTPSWLDTKKTTFLYWPWCTEGLEAAAGAHFWPQNLHFFTLRLYNPHFFRSDGPDSMGSYVPHVLW